MNNLSALPRMRGFNTAISRADARTGVGAIALGVDDDGDRLTVMISLTHADGTSLTAALSDEQLGRLADILAEQHGIVGLVAATSRATVQ